MEGNELKNLRISLDLTQDELAEILEVKRNTVARWENGVLKVPKTVELAMQTIKADSKKKPTK